MKDNYSGWDIWEREEAERLKEVANREKGEKHLSLPREGQGEKVEDVQLSNEGEKSTQGNHGQPKEIRRRRGRRWGRT